MCSSKGSPASISAFPVRYTHSAREVCDTGDLAALAALVLAGLARLPEASLDRDAWT